jgi:transmembrane sensor
MNEHLAPPSDAAEWFLAIYAEEEPSAETVQAWLRWLDSSAENRRAFEDIVQIWHATPSAVVSCPDKPAAEEEYDGSISIAEWRRRRQTISIARSRRRPFLAIAAAALLAAVGVVSYRALIPSPVSQGEFVTRTGEHRQIELADGSHVTLGAHSRLSVDLKPDARDLHLGAGEAYFSVAKDARRPFVVRALNGQIVALGTAFNVRSVEGRVTVTVTEGSVKVTDASVRTAALSSALPEPMQRLSRGEQLTYRQAKDSFAAAAEKVEHVDVNESARWREGWLVYRDEPLKYVIADILRYTNLHVEVAALAADVQFSGAVFRDDIDEWILALPEVASVSVERTGAGYVIRSKSAGTTMARGSGEAAQK